MPVIRQPPLRQPVAHRLYALVTLPIRVLPDHGGQRVPVQIGLVPAGTFIASHRHAVQAELVQGQAYLRQDVL